MSPWLSNRRAFMTLYALLMMSLLLTLALGQYSLVRALIRGSAAGGLGSDIETALLDSPHHIKLTRQAGQAGNGQIGDHGFAWSWQGASGSRVSMNQITITFENRGHWPQSIGLWVNTPNLHIYLRDYRRR